MQRADYVICKLATGNWKLDSTNVECSLQIAPFMQNKPNFRKTQMNVTYFISKNYEQRTMNNELKNKPKQSQFPRFPFCNTSQNGKPPIILVSLNWLCIISFYVMVNQNIGICIWATESTENSENSNLYLFYLGGLCVLSGLT
jgi:hypothetical protein